MWSSSSTTSSRRATPAMLPRLRNAPVPSPGRHAISMRCPGSSQRGERKVVSVVTASAGGRTPITRGVDTGVLEAHGDEVTIRLTDDLLADGLADVRWLLHDALLAGARRLVVDLSRVTVLSSTAVASFLSADRKSTRLNSSHANISYAVFCLKKQNNDMRSVVPAPSTT